MPTPPNADLAPKKLLQIMCLDACFIFKYSMVPQILFYFTKFNLSLPPPTVVKGQNSETIIYPFIKIYLPVKKLSKLPPPIQQERVLNILINI